MGRRYKMPREDIAEQAWESASTEEHDTMWRVTRCKVKQRIIKAALTINTQLVVISVLFEVERCLQLNG